MLLLLQADGAPSLPPDSFTRTPLSMNFARSKAFSFLDMAAATSAPPASQDRGQPC